MFGPFWVLWAIGFVEWQGLPRKPFKGRFHCQDRRSCSPGADRHMGLTSFIMELGEVVERNLKNKAVLIVLILLAALFHVVSFILFGIIVLTVYARSLRGPVPFRPQRDEKETGAIIIGVGFFGFGLWAVIRIYVPEFGWQIAPLIVGSLLIAFGISRRGGMIETEQ